MKLAIASLAAVVLAGCATAAEPGMAEPQGECVAEPGQAFIGKEANSETGAALLKATGAARIRWVPPRTAVTMDFQPDRLTVHYDDAMVIERVSCT
ncbi:MAG TPA: I78 family peptidase inhibitor [Sphingomonadaceae bacterium]|nr:I78 family peptidase inhibitor [Sphingomonadaceae bacterium]